MPHMSAVMPHMSAVIKGSIPWFKSSQKSVVVAFEGQSSVKASVEDSETLEQSWSKARVKLE